MSLAKLQILELFSCAFLENDVISLHRLQSIRKVEIGECSSWRTLNGIQGLQELEELGAWDCEKLFDVSALGSL